MCACERLKVESPVKSSSAEGGVSKRPKITLCLWILNSQVRGDGRDSAAFVYRADDKPTFDVTVSCPHTMTDDALS